MFISKKKLEQLENRILDLERWVTTNKKPIQEAVVRTSCLGEWLGSPLQKTIEEITLRLMAVIDYLELEIKENWKNDLSEPPVRRKQIRYYKAVKKPAKKIKFSELGGVINRPGSKIQTI